MSCGCINPVCGGVMAQQFTCEDNAGREVEFIDLEAFLPRVSLVANGVPDDVALEYLRQAAQQLARESRLLKRVLYLDVQAGVKDYYIQAGENEQVHLIHQVEYKASQQAPHCANSHQSCIVSLKQCRSDVFTFEPPDKILLRHAPKKDSEGQLVVHYFAMPTQNACEVDQLLYDRYQDIVVNGALGWLLMMSKYEFAEPQLALHYNREFRKGIASVKIDTMRGFETGTQKLMYGGRL